MGRTNQCARKSTGDWISKRNHRLMKKLKVKPNIGGVKKPKRYRPGTVVLMEIRKYQRGTGLQKWGRGVQVLYRQ